MSSAVHSILSQINDLPADERSELIRELMSPECVYLGMDARKDLRTGLVDELELEVNAERKWVEELSNLRKATEDDEELLDEENDAREDLARKEDLLAAVKKLRSKHLIDAKNETLILKAVENAKTEKGAEAKQRTKTALTAILRLLDKGLSFAEVSERLDRSPRWAEGRLWAYGLMALVERLRNNRAIILSTDK